MNADHDEVKVVEALSGGAVVGHWVQVTRGAPHMMRAVRAFVPGATMPDAARDVAIRACSDTLTVRAIAALGCTEEHDHDASPFCSRTVDGKRWRWSSPKYQAPERPWTDEEQAEAGLDL